MGPLYQDPAQNLRRWNLSHCSGAGSDSSSELPETRVSQGHSKPNDPAYIPPRPGLKGSRRLPTLLRRHHESAAGGTPVARVWKSQNPGHTASSGERRAGKQQDVLGSVRAAGAFLEELVADPVPEPALPKLRRLPTSPLRIKRSPKLPTRGRQRPSPLQRRRRRACVERRGKEKAALREPSRPKAWAGTVGQCRQARAPDVLCLQAHV